VKGNALRIVRTDRNGVALDTTTSANAPSPELANLKASLRLHNKGRVEGYAQALMDTGPVPPTPEKHDEWMQRYRERAAKRYPLTPEVA